MNFKKLFIYITYIIICCSPFSGKASNQWAMHPVRNCSKCLLTKQ